MQGQKHIADILKEAVISGRAGHAYLFAGPEGIGKRTMAGIFARLLLCESSNSGSSYENIAACGSCLPCRLAGAGTNPDFRVVRRADSQSIRIEEIRELQADIIIKPVYSGRKVIIIEEADKMTEQAQNCFLKTLEEPPPYAVIIMTAVNPDNLLETVLSRVTGLNFSRNTPDEVKNAIYGKFGGYSAKTDFVVTFSEGIIGLAIKLEESGSFESLREKALEIIIRLKTDKETYIYEAGKFFDDNKVEIDTILGIMISFYRDLLTTRCTGNKEIGNADIDSILINRDKKDIIIDMCGSYSAGGLEESIHTIAEIQAGIRRNASYQLSIGVMLMKLYGHGKGVMNKGAAVGIW